MTRNKSFKTRVRARMDKTGESYTTARRQLLHKVSSAPDEAAADQRTAAFGPESASAPNPETTNPPAADGVKAQQFSDASVRERTGRGWDEWFSRLDAWGATGRTHTEIARWLVAEQRVEGWWAQSITVAYEQARGMRAPGQGADGYVSASASKTIAVPVDRLFAAFADAELRERWLPGVMLRVRTATAPKSFRADWEDGSTRIVVGFTAKGDAKAQVAISHEKLADADAAARMKAYWRDRFTDLKQHLEGRSRRPSLSRSTRSSPTSPR